MQTIGLCRFSYPAIGGFQVDFEDMQEKLDYLYAPSRMEERFATFETITLPPLRAQTDPDFTLIVVVGESMPAPYRTRLEALLADIPQAVIQARPPKRHRAIMKELINDVRGPDVTCLQFRMDDDDAVSVDFVQRLRQVAGDVKKMSKRDGMLAIDFNRGFIVRPGPDGIKAVETAAPYHTAALALMLSPKSHQTIMNFAHHKLAERMTTVTLTNTPAMLLRGHNDFNDSRQGPNTKAYKLALMDQAGEALLRERFNIDSDAVRAAFAAL